MVIRKLVDLNLSKALRATAEEGIVGKTTTDKRMKEDPESTEIIR